MQVLNHPTCVICSHFPLHGWWSKLLSSDWGWLKTKRDIFWYLCFHCWLENGSQSIKSGTCLHYAFIYVHCWHLWYLTNCQETDGEIYHISEEEEWSDRLHFIKFETKYIETCVDFIQQNLVGTAESLRDKFIKVTGGGAYKYKKLLSNKLGVQWVNFSAHFGVEFSLKKTNTLWLCEWCWNGCIDFM